MLLAYNFFYGWATAVYGIFHHSYRSVPEALGTDMLSVTNDELVSE
jgi:hypothetical protein